MSNFFKDRDERGAPLEILIAQHFHNLGIPVGFNPYSGTEDPRREQYDIYAGRPDAETFLEIKMDWASGISGNIFVEQKTLKNTLAQKMVFGRLIIDVFDTDKLRQMYGEKLAQPIFNERKGEWQMDKYRKIIGGEQANNRGMLLSWRDCKDNSQTLWLLTKQLKQQQ